MVHSQEGILEGIALKSPNAAFRQGSVYGAFVTHHAACCWGRRG
jgi:hypothetical protein